MERRKLLALSTAMLALAPLRSLHAQSTASTAKPYTSEQLDQMLAPIALYPDALLAQTLMAAGYPLEVVEAARWSAANPALKGDAAVAAVKDKSWDVSVKSLTAFPQTLKMMNDQLDWTQKVGDAMIAQQKDVAESVQRLRAKAAAAGNLKTTPQQKVTTQPPAAGGGSTIVIEPANPETIYVPYYNPAWAYGPWPYPAYPPPYYPPPPNYGAALMTGMMFGVGMAAGAAMFGGWNWNHGNTYVNVNRATSISANNFNANHYANGNWSHDPAHRDGVPYNDRALQQKYGQNRPGSAERDQYRGQQFQNELRGGQAGQRDGAARTNAEQRAGSGERAGAGASERTAASTRSASESHSGGAFNGVNHGQQVNREADRGRSYGGSSGRSFSGGGGGRGGRR
jgi:hypothetical protein